MPLDQFTVECGVCDYKSFPFAANADEAIWQCGVDPKTSKCPKCKTGQLTATTAAPAAEPLPKG